MSNEEKARKAKQIDLILFLRFGLRMVVDVLEEYEEIDRSDHAAAIFRQIEKEGNANPKPFARSAAIAMENVEWVIAHIRHLRAGAKALPQKPMVQELRGALALISSDIVVDFHLDTELEISGEEAVIRYLVDVLRRAFEEYAHPLKQLVGRLHTWAEDECDAYNEASSEPAVEVIDEYLAPHAQADLLAFRADAKSVARLQKAQKIREVAKAKGLPLRTEKRGRQEWVHRADWKPISDYWNQHGSLDGYKPPAVSNPDLEWECTSCNFKIKQPTRPTKCPKCLPPHYFIRCSNRDPRAK